jgi:hypothetical protein
MPRADWRSIGFCLLAVALCGASVPRASVAEEAPAKSGRQAAAESKGGNGDHAAGEGAGKPERNPINSTGQETGPERGQERGQEKGQETGQESDRSDSRIAVEPHGPPANREDGRGPKAMLRSFTHGNVQAHRSLAARPSGPVVRNAIGVAVGPRDNSTHRDGHVAPLVVRSAVGAVGVSAGANGGIARASGIPETNKFAHPAPTPGVAPLHRGTISGTGLVQRGSGPAQIGGPAKSFAGINGTNIRPKH